MLKLIVMFILAIIVPLLLTLVISVGVVAGLAFYSEKYGVKKND